MDRQHLMRRRIAQTFAALLLLLVIAACGADSTTAATEALASDPDTEAVASETSSSSPVAEPEAAAEPASIEEAPAADQPPADEEPAAAEAASESEAAVGQPAVANASYLGSYELTDESFGTVVTVTVEGDTRTIESNALPNHDTGEFPNSGNPNAISAQDRSWELPTDPIFTGQATTTRETGVALNGVKFEPGTAEEITCSSGERYRIEGLQDMFDLGMDFNNAHVQPTGEYHYHGASQMLVDAFASDEDLVLVGFAGDGHFMYYSKSGAYSSSYALSTDARTGTDCEYRTGGVDLDGTSPDGTYVSDWLYTAGSGDLDECNGTVIDGQYAYLVTDEYPYISRCLMGEAAGAGPGGGGGAPAGGGAQGGGPPDLSAAAAALGLSTEELQDALGGPPPDVAAAAEDARHGRG